MKLENPYPSRSLSFSIAKRTFAFASDRATKREDKVKKEKELIVFNMFLNKNTSGRLVLVEII